MIKYHDGPPTALGHWNWNKDKKKDKKVMKAEQVCIYRGSGLDIARISFLMSPDDDTRTSGRLVREVIVQDYNTESKPSEDMVSFKPDDVSSVFRSSPFSRSHSLWRTFFSLLHPYPYSPAPKASLPQHY